MIEHSKAVKKFEGVKKFLLSEKIDGWLLWDYCRSNPLAHAFLAISPDQMASRRFCYWIPSEGEPVKIVSCIEPFILDHLPGEKWIYHGWKELEAKIAALPLEKKRIAMEYSPLNALPDISKVDAGVVEWATRRGAEVVSSANLLQRYTNVVSQEQLQSHLFAAAFLDSLVACTWEWIETSLQSRRAIDEFDVQQFMWSAIQESGFTADHQPICAVNAHSADPHYHPTRESARSIQHGDFILLDLWCKHNRPGSIYADISRVAVAAKKGQEKHEKIFSIVKEARDAAIAFIKERCEKRCPVMGCEVDRVCRDVIEASGFGQYFLHRTGHNIGELVHGTGANLDDFETHDDRQLIAGTIFSIEPGIYLPGDFGVRLECDVYLDPNGEVRITGGMQSALHVMPNRESRKV